MPVSIHVSSSESGIIQLLCSHVWYHCGRFLLVFGVVSLLLVFGSVGLDCVGVFPLFVVVANVASSVRYSFLGLTCQ